MKFLKMFPAVFMMLVFSALFFAPRVWSVNAAYDLDSLPDMSDFDPLNPPDLGDDTIKIAVIAAFSGPASTLGEAFYMATFWAAHDLNKRGGIMVDGKRKKIEIIKADNKSRPDVTKKVTERMIFKENVDILWGSHMSHLTRIVSQLAEIPPEKILPKADPDSAPGKNYFCKAKPGNGQPDRFPLCFAGLFPFPTAILRFFMDLHVILIPMRATAFGPAVWP